jgi:hypothetical protein
VPPIMLAGPAYVEWTDAQVLLRRHKIVLIQAAKAQVFL